MSVHDANKALIAPMRAALRFGEGGVMRAALHRVYVRFQDDLCFASRQVASMKARSDKTRHLGNGGFFGDHDFAAITGWRSGSATHSGEGFPRLRPTGKRFSRRSLDVWRIEDGLIRENWVMVDMLDVYRQLGVDVLARMQEKIGETHAA